MNKVQRITLFALMALTAPVSICLGSGLAASDVTPQAAPAQAGHMEVAPSKSILQSVIPRINLKQATLPEAVQFLERESKRLDPDHRGLKIIVLRPKDFGNSEELSVHGIDLSATKLSIDEALKDVAEVFHLKVEIQKDVYLMPIDADFETWKRQHRRQDGAVEQERVGRELNRRTQRAQRTEKRWNVSPFAGLRASILADWTGKGLIPGRS